MNTGRLTILSVLLALVLALSVLPASLAEAPLDAVQDSAGMADYTKVRWFAESDGWQTGVNGMAFEDARLEIDAVPGSIWTLRAEYVKVRDARLIPFRGQSDVTEWCEWTSEALTLADGAVVMPEAEGVYALSGRFVDDDGGAYLCEIRFDVSADHVAANGTESDVRANEMTVAEKVRQITDECRAENFSTEYEIAVWLHDWLIYNANYDYTYSNYDADGVLLKGTGVCDSYSKAFCLLLDAFDIENHRVISDAINHAWNIAKIDGTWCYVDCTWDDPGTGGDENHNYFGMNTDLISRDHVLEDSQPEATSLANYYPLREGLPCYATPEELDAVLSEQMGNKATTIELVYIGTESEPRIYNDVQAWLSDNSAAYGLMGYGMSYGDYSLTLKNLSYSGSSQPAPQPDKHLATPVAAKDFELDSPYGRYLLKNYKNNGLVLVFGRTTCGNTLSLLNNLKGTVPELYAAGVDVLVSLYGLTTPEDVAAMEESYSGYHYAYESDYLFDYLNAVGYNSNSVTFPCVFIINQNAKITYYSTGYVQDVSEIVSEARAVATSHTLPAPETSVDLTPMLNGSGNVNDIADGEAIVSALQSATRSGYALLLTDYYPNESQLQYFEDHFSLFDRLNFTLVASYVDMSDEEKQAYPHCSFVDYSNSDFWSLLRTAGHNENRASYMTHMLVEPGGNIVAYTNGSALKPGNCLVYAARQLVYATIPAGLEVVNGEVFSGTAFMNMDLSGGHLREIADGAFANCGALDFIRIPESVTAIGDDAFTGGKPVIVCTLGSAAQKYAVRKGFEYICD